MNTEVDEFASELADRIAIRSLVDAMGAPPDFAAPAAAR